MYLSIIALLFIYDKILFTKTCIFPACECALQNKALATVKLSLF